jgi:hypothetical protein
VSIHLRNPGVLALAAALSLGVVGCGGGVDAVDETDGLEETLDDAIVGGASGYYTVRRDFRRCASPMCGGFWIGRVNQGLLRCPGASTSTPECYVATLDTSRLGEAALGESFPIARGRLSQRTFGQAGRFAVLNVSEGWLPATSAASTEPLWKVADNGLRCVTTPCFSLSAARLNTTTERRVAELDLSGLGLSAEQQDAASRALFEGGVLAAGATPARGAGRFVARQLYLRWAPPPPAQCLAPEECTTTLYPTKVERASDCYCPTCPVPVSGAVAVENQASWQRFCGARSGSCLMPPCAAPPPVGCVDGACTYVVDGL